MRFTIMVVGLTLGVLGAGCGVAADTTAPAATSPATAVPQSSAPAPVATAGTSDDELRAAVQAYSDAFLTGDAKTAYGLLSGRCRKRMSEAEFTAIAGAAEKMYGSALPLATYSAKVSGDLARVTYTYAIKAINQDAEPWTREDGSWRQDDC